MAFDFDDPNYYDVKAVEKELARATGLCDGCRRCYRLCTPFDFMLDDCPLPGYAAPQLEHRFSSSDASGEGGASQG